MKDKTNGKDGLPAHDTTSVGVLEPEALILLYYEGPGCCTIGLPTGLRSGTLRVVELLYLREGRHARTPPTSTK